MVYHFNISTLNHAMRYSTLLTVTSFIALPSLFVLPTVLGQTLAPVHRLPLNEPLETSKNMPAAPPRKIETSPSMISQFGVFTSYQANVDASGNNILGDAANESAIAVDPTDGNKMTIGWRQFDSIQSDFRQGGWGYTTDAGVHWTLESSGTSHVLQRLFLIDRNHGWAVGLGGTILTVGGARPPSLR